MDLIFHGADGIVRIDRPWAERKDPSPKVKKILSILLVLSKKIKFEEVEDIKDTISLVLSFR